MSKVLEESHVKALGLIEKNAVSSARLFELLMKRLERLEADNENLKNSIRTIMTEMNERTEMELEHRKWKVTY